MKKYIASFMLIILFLCSTSFPVSAKGVNYKEIDWFIKEQMEEQSIVGLSCAIVKNGRIEHINAFGKAGKDEKLSPQTPMKIGSLSKSFTALAIMQLVEQGAVDLDRPVTDYIPSFQLQDQAESSKITVSDLLYQISGIPGTADMDLANELKGKSLEETVKLLNRIEMSNPPKEKFEYSNFNYVILGLIVEEVSGESLGEYINLHILEPLEMGNSYTSVQEAAINQLSNSYSPWFGKHLSVKTFMDNLSNFLASGYMVSSAEDMGKYLISYMEGSKILSSDGIRNIQAPSSLAVMKMNGEYYGNYAMGWFSREVQGVDVLGHAGDLPSVAQADMYILPESNQGVVLISNTNNNYAPGSLHVLTDGVISLLAGKDPVIGDSNLKGFKRFYLISNGIVGMGLLVFIWSLYRLKRWNRRINRASGLRKVWANGWWFLQLILPVFVYMLPGLLGYPRWSIISAVQPDLINCVLACFFWMFLIGVLKLFIQLFVVFRNGRMLRKSIFG